MEDKLPTASESVSVWSEYQAEIRLCLTHDRSAVEAYAITWEESEEDREGAIEEDGVYLSSEVSYITLFDIDDLIAELRRAVSVLESMKNQKPEAK